MSINTNVRIIKDKQEAKYIFTMGMLTEDINRNNYSEEQFEKAWVKWLGFYVLYENKNIICFGGIRVFDGGYARIFDRYFIMPEYRSYALTTYHTDYALEMINMVLDRCELDGLIPFFSIQLVKKRNAMKAAVGKFNKYLNGREEFKILEGLYCTTPGNYGDNSWQNIATIYPYTTILERKERKIK